MSNTDKNQKKNQSIAVDAAAVKQLADLFKETDLSEIEYETEGCRIRVARNSGMPMGYSAPAMMPAPVQSTQVVVDAPQQAAAKQESASLDKHPGAIKSPMVGTAYLSPQPGAKPFVTAGGSVKEGDTIMIVEAMKVMNPIRAPRSGKVKEIFVQDATPVEFDDLLLIIE
jgi:acetyl-CoA carboxylase biotin carboxyl carrier protein